MVNGLYLYRTFLVFRSLKTFLPLWVAVALVVEQVIVYGLYVEAAVS